MTMKGIYMNIDFNKVILKSLPYIIIIVVVYTITTILFLLLPKYGLSFVDNNDNFIYKPYKFYSNTKNSNVQNNKIDEKNIETLDRYELKAIVSSSLNKGWIIIEEKFGNRENITLFYGEEINGYYVKNIFKDYIIFEKNKKEFILKLDIENNTTHERNNSDISQIRQKNNGAIISKTYLNSYINNLDQIWRNISIIENINDGKIDGFIIKKIAKNSDFIKLGLKEGDIMKSVNNNKLTSYAEALNVFNEINNTKYVNIVILRNNEIMELNYEIN